MASPVSADGGPHRYTATPSATTDGCASCHRLHTAQGSHLLKDIEPMLCLSCHGQDAEGANNDVEDGIGYISYGNPSGKYDPHRTGNGGTYGTTGKGGTYVAGAPIGALRSGGFSYALIGSALATGQQATPDLQESLNTGNIPVLPLPTATGDLNTSMLVPVTSSHAVGGTDTTAWGNGTSGYGSTIQLRCSSCHDPHGNGNYRILRPIPVQSGASTGVTIADETTDSGFSKAYITTNYWDIQPYELKMTSATTWTYQKPVAAQSFIPNISAWCTTCHTRFMAASGSGEVSTGDATYTYLHKSDGTTQGSANCIQCHVAHGSNASMGTGTQSSQVTLPDGTAGDSYLLRIDQRGICEMCHKR